MALWLVVIAEDTALMLQTPNLDVISIIIQDVFVPNRKRNKWG